MRSRRERTGGPGALGPRARASDGQWFGVVTFHLAHRDGRSDRYIADRQIIPARGPPSTLNDSSPDSGRGGLPGKSSSPAVVPLSGVPHAQQSGL